MLTVFSTFKALQINNMKKTTTLLLLIFFLGSFSLSAQSLGSKSYLNTTFVSYNKELQLSPEKAKQFKDILKQYNKKFAKLIKQRASKNEYNNLIKLHDLAIFKIFDRDQFAKYKVLRKELEPLKKYRYDK